jgi:hypothetical protein
MPREFHASRCECRVEPDTSYSFQQWFLAWLGTQKSSASERPQLGSSGITILTLGPPHRDCREECAEAHTAAGHMAPASIYHEGMAQPSPQPNQLHMSCPPPALTFLLAEKKAEAAGLAGGCSAVPSYAE